MRTFQEDNMMGDTRNPQEEADRRKRAEATRDPEFEMPDPEQVDRDIEQAERLYREKELERNKKPAA
jgi:hypothetical protein